MAYKEELINSIEADFVFAKEPINIFNIKEKNIDKNKNNKIKKKNNLKKKLNSIQNCKLREIQKSNSWGWEHQ